MNCRTPAPAGGGTLTDPPSGGGGGVVLVDKVPVGYWIDDSGYPALNGIYVRRKPRAKQRTGSGLLSPEQQAAGETDDDHLTYEHMETHSLLKWVAQGWLLELRDGTDCFLQ